MEQLFLATGIALLLLMALSLYRVIAGPTILDRILGGNVIGTKTTVMLLVIGVLYDNVGMFVDIAIAYAMLNFIATLGATKYFLRRKSIHLEDSP
ncbi:monovalent cation/H+ antiporter complex subunit F [Trichloromonas sp.]|uniref:monovalent cation/H+ antiporter complex subunit F n=1 Tax=Trichloromonas sp. TaxID=3069249 RepID=UPI003D815E4B